MSVLASIQDYVLNAVKATLSTTGVYVGALPSKEGVSICIASGAVVDESLKRTQFARVTMAVNAKSQNQRTALEWLEKVHADFNSKISFLNTEEVQITRIITNNAPTYTGQEGNEWYLYGSSITISYYNKKEA